MNETIQTVVTVQFHTFLSARFKLRKPLPTGVIKGLFNPTLLRFTLCITSFGMPIVPSGYLTGVTSTGSQSIGTSAASNILEKCESG